MAKQNSGSAENPLNQLVYILDLSSLSILECKSPTY